MPLPRPAGRRLFLVLLFVPILFLLFLYFLSPARLPGLFVSDHAQPPDEIFDEAGRVITAPGSDDPQTRNDGGSDTGQVQGSAALGDQGAGPVAPEEPVPMAWYAFGSMANARTFRLRGSSSDDLDGGWNERLRTLREEHPLVVFSKSYCPYSKRAKRLLETYSLSPAPKIIEVDLRVDSSHIKTLLTRITNRSTFPNVILNGRSLGGSDELMRLHEEHQLRPTLEKAGVKVGRTGEGGDHLRL